MGTIQRLFATMFLLTMHTALLDAHREHKVRLSFFPHFKKRSRYRISSVNLNFKNKKKRVILYILIDPTYSLLLHRDKIDLTADNLPHMYMYTFQVHNIVLYPDKHSWCKTTPIKQVVTWPQCSSQELDNNVCVGACFSYMVPHSEPSAPGDLIRPYCDSCQPLDSVWHTVSICSSD